MLLVYGGRWIDWCGWKLILGDKNLYLDNEKIVGLKHGGITARKKVVYQVGVETNPLHNFQNYMVRCVFSSLASKKQIPIHSILCYVILNSVSIMVDSVGPADRAGRQGSLPQPNKILMHNWCSTGKLIIKKTVSSLCPRGWLLVLLVLALLSIYAKQLT